MDADGQMDPSWLPTLVGPIRAGRADYVKGNRFLHTRTLLQMPLIRRIGNIGLSFLSKLASGYWPIFDPTNGYVALHAALLPLLDESRIARRFFFETSMLIELSLHRAVVRDVYMPARYGDKAFIGSRLCELAAEQRHSVRTLTRRDWSARPDVPIDQRFFGSFPNEIPTAALRGADVVVHCAAVTEAAPRQANAVNVTGTLELARAARSAGVRTFIFLSTQSAKAHATSVYGRTKFEAEQALSTVTDIDVIVIRPGLVCGPGSRGLFQRMCTMVDRLPVLPLLAGGVAIVQPIAVDDLCEAIFRCASRSSEFAGAILHLGDPVGMSLRDFLQQLAQARLGRRKIALPVPLGPVALGVRAAELLRMPLPINANNVKGLAAVEAMPSAPDLARLGLTLRPIAERVLASGGGVVLIEPYYGPLARFLFKRLHASETFDSAVSRWEAERPVGAMSNANQALSYVVFVRDRAIFEREFPELEILCARPHTHLMYVLSGSLNFRQLVPSWAGSLLGALEWLLTPLNPWLALQHTLVLRRRPEGWTAPEALS